MGGMIQRDGKWVQPERVLGDVVPSYHWPAMIPVPPAQYPGYGKVASHGCVCPAGAEKTCQGPLCPRKAPVPTP
jgi:hypothetical protein